MRRMVTDYLDYYITGKRIRARIYYHPFRIMYYGFSKSTEHGCNRLSQFFYDCGQLLNKSVIIKILQPA
jgi:hypothetical protein